MDRAREVALACRLSREPYESNFWQFLQYFSADELPLPSGRRFNESELVDAVSEALRLNDARETWAGDREVWVRHDLNQAELMAGAA